MKTIDAMSESRKRYLTLFSWFSLFAPLIVYGLCYLVYSPPYPLDRLVWWGVPWGHRYDAEVFTRHYGFLVAIVVGGLVLLADIGFKRWRLVGLPLVGLVFACWLYVQAGFFLQMFRETALAA
jgi:hypothetical protein